MNNTKRKDPTAIFCDPMNDDEINLADLPGTMRQLEDRLLHAPNNGELWFKCGWILCRQSKIKEARAALEKSYALGFEHPVLFSLLGYYYESPGEAEQAIEFFKKSLELAPGNYQLHFMQALRNLSLERVDEAKKLLENECQKLESKFDVNGQLGIIALSEHDIKKSFSYFAKSHQEILERNIYLPARNQMVFHKIKHDYDQLTYLIEQDKINPKDFYPYYEQLEELVKTYDEKGKNENFALHVNEDIYKNIMPSYSETIYHLCPAALPESPLNCDLNFKQIEEEYFDADPKMVVIDDFLSEKALHLLRQDCLESTIWKKVYRNGYLGALLSAGFASPLLLQISDEIRTKMPRIFAAHMMHQSWAFKCDSQHKGITLHADFAIVNLNLWITKQSALQQEGRSGLIVYDSISPDNWSFSDYNSKEGKIREFIRSSGAKPINIPYQENRILIFDSTLFHETDEIFFKDGYENRRLNVTFLYGQRLSI